MTNDVITVAIYVRVSTEEQAKHGYSVQAQKESLISYCKEKKYKVYDIYADEGKSARAKLKNRTEMCRLLEDVKQKKFDRIIFIKLDRWFRNIADYYKVQEILDKYKIDWETTQEDYNTTTSSGRLNLNIRLSIAQDEADRTADRIRFTFESMVKNKRAIQGSHCMPLGYKVSSEENNKRVIKDENTMHIVEDMFNHFALYGSTRKTLIYLNAKYNLSLNYDSVRKYLKNRLYTGFYRNIENYCEPYITLDQYNQNQARIKSNVKEYEKKYDYIFSGLIKCYHCKNRMGGFTHTSHDTKYNRKYKNHAYRCNRAYCSKLCRNRSPIFESVVEKYLLKNIVEDAKQYIIEGEKTYAIEDKKVINVDKLKQKLDRLTELYIDGKISREKYNNDFNKVNQEIESAKTEERKVKDLSNVKSIVNSNALDLYNQLDNVSKRAFWSTYIDYIERDEHRNFIVHFK